MALQGIGDDWVADLQVPVLKVPSVVSPNEFNYLLNPLHPDFSRVFIRKPETLVWDRRLIERYSS